MTEVLWIFLSTLVGLKALEHFVLWTLRSVEFITIKPVSALTNKVKGKGGAALFHMHYCYITSAWLWHTPTASERTLWKTKTDYNLNERRFYCTTVVLGRHEYTYTLNPAYKTLQHIMSLLILCLCISTMTVVLSSNGLSEIFSSACAFPSTESNVLWGRERAGGEGVKSCLLLSTWVCSAVWSHIQYVCVCERV